MTDANFERAQRLDAQFRNMDFDAVPVGQPIDERSLLAAASDPNAIPMDKMKALHDRNKRRETDQINQLWSNQASALPDITTKQTVDPKHIAYPNLETQRTNVVLQKFKDIAHDLTHFKDLPQKTNLEKVQVCFFSDGRAYVSVTSFIAFCILMIIIVVICMGSRRS